MAAHLGEEEGDGEEGHDGEGAQRLLDLERDLVLEVFGVVDGGLVEDEDVRQAGGDEVDDEAEDPIKTEALVGGDVGRGREEIVSLSTQKGSNHTM